MRLRGNRGKPRGEFARELTKVLIAKDVNNSYLWACLVQNGQVVGKAFIDMMVVGSRHPPVDLIDPICSVMGLSDERRAELHRAAAIDRGYRIGDVRAA